MLLGVPNVVVQKPRPKLINVAGRRIAKKKPEQSTRFLYGAKFKPRIHKKGARRRRFTNNWVREVRNAQKQVALCIPRLRFSRLVREITENLGRIPGVRFQSSALAALQAGAESILTMWFEML